MVTYTKIHLQVSLSRSPSAPCLRASAFSPGTLFMLRGWKVIKGLNAATMMDQEKTNAFHTTVHSPESQGEKYPSFKQHDPGKLNMMWKRADLLHYFTMFSYSGLLHLRHENRNGPFVFLGQCVRHFTSYWKGHFVTVIFTEKINGLEDALPMMQCRDTALCEPEKPCVAINLVCHMPRGIP